HRSQSGNPVPALKEGKDPPRHKAPREPRAPWERRAHGPRSDSMSGLPQYLPTPDELVLAPPRAPKKQKPQPKPGFICAQPPQTLSGLDRIPAFLDLLKQALHFFQRPRRLIQRHPTQLAGHIVVQTVQVLSNLTTQLLVQRSLQRTNDTDGAAHRRPPAFGVPGLLGVPCQFQTLDG